MDRKNKKKVSNAHKHEKEIRNDCGFPLEKLNLAPKKKLLVFGLDGVLIYRVFFRDKPNILKNRPHEAYYAGHLVFRRTYFQEFMKFCFGRFDVGIWSSSKEVNIDAVSTLVLKGFGKKPMFAWDPKYCTDSGFTIEENKPKKKKKPIVFKELKKLWEPDDSLNHPWIKGQYTSSNTLLIDEEPHRALLNPPNTAIFPEPYNVDNENENTLGWNGDLKMFLEGLVFANDVPSYVKENPIGRPAITPSHSDWKDYSQIIQHFSDGPATKGMFEKCENLFYKI